MKKSKRNGFTLIDTLMALLVCSIVSMVGGIFISCCLNIMTLKPLHQNQIAILQIRQILSISHDINIKNNSLYMIYGHKEICFKEDRNRLVQSDGYEIWMEGIQNVYFFEENGSIYMQYCFNKKNYQAQLV